MAVRRAKLTGLSSTALSLRPVEAGQGRSPITSDLPRQEVARITSWMREKLSSACPIMSSLTTHRRTRAVLALNSVTGKRAARLDGKMANTSQCLGWLLRWSALLLKNTMCLLSGSAQPISRLVNEGSAVMSISLVPGVRRTMATRIWLVRSPPHNS